MTSARTDARPGILAVNGGSSSLKFAYFEPSESLGRVLNGRVERIGIDAAEWTLFDADGARLAGGGLRAPDHRAAAEWVIARLDEQLGRGAIGVIGHRIVHGGSRFYQPERITRDVVDELKRISPLDPEHLPTEIAIIDAFTRALPAIPQVACFDTAFHHDLPRVARIIPVPRRYEALGIRRYGFHGLSYAYLMEELQRIGGRDLAARRTVLAHLGSGASLAAVHEGKCRDTTMGFTPTAGVVMSRRCGDLDPGVTTFLARTEGLSVDQLDHMVNQESGLLGVSETSPDLRDLLAREPNDPRAAEAVALFCYRIQQAIGALAATLGGLETLVFAGGIGENSTVARARICDNLGFLGIELDPEANAASAAVISRSDGRVLVRVIKTDEESMIARLAQRTIGIT